MNKQLVFLLPVVLCLAAAVASCGAERTEPPEGRSSVHKPKDLLKLTQVGTLTLGVPNNFYPKHSGLAGYCDDSIRRREYLYLLNNARAEVYRCAWPTLQAPNHSTCQAIDLSHLFSSPYPIEAMGIVSADTLAFIDGDLQNICLTDATGHALRKWQPRCPIYGRTRYFIDTNLQPLYARAGKLYLQAGPDIGSIIDDTAAFRRYLKHNAGLILSAKDTAAANNRTGAFPPFLGPQNSFNITAPYTCVTPRGNYVFSYGPFSELHEYEPGGHEKVVDAPSRYHRAAKGMPYTYFTNRLALTHYKLTEPEYTRLVSDPYRRKYLRVYMHGIPSATQRAIRPAYTDVPWSLMILNEELKVVGETNLPPDYDPRLIFATRNGVAIGFNRPGRPGYRPGRLVFKLFRYSSPED